MAERKEEFTQDYGELKVNFFMKESVQFINTIDIGKILETSFMPYLKPSLILRIKQNVSDVCKRELRDNLNIVCERGKLAKKFNILKHLENKHQGCGKAWRPPANVNSHCRTARIIANRQLKEDMQTIIKFKMMNIEKLKTEIIQAQKSSNLLKDKRSDLNRKIENCKDLSNTIQCNLKNFDESLLLKLSQCKEKYC